MFDKVHHQAGLLAQSIAGPAPIQPNQLPWSAYPASFTPPGAPLLPLCDAWVCGKLILQPFHPVHFNTATTSFSTSLVMRGG
jgi:hypothetical protein